MFDSATQLLQSPRVEHLQPETSRPRTPKADSSDRMESTLARRATLCFFRREGDTVGQVQQEHALRAKLQ